MPKKTKTPEEHAKTIEYLLAGLLLKRDVNLKQVAKIIGCHTNILTKMYPERNRKKK
jgi:hypothetical protein